MNRQSKGSADRGETVPHQAPDLRPITVRIPVAVQLTGISRTKLYELIKCGQIEIIKLGSITLIPVDSLNRFVESRRR